MAALDKWIVEEWESLTVFFKEVGTVKLNIIIDGKKTDADFGIDNKIMWRHETDNISQLKPGSIRSCKNFAMVLFVL